MATVSLHLLPAASLSLMSSMKQFLNVSDKVSIMKWGLNLLLFMVEATQQHIASYLHIVSMKF